MLNLCHQAKLGPNSWRNPCSAVAASPWKHTAPEPPPFTSRKTNPSRRTDQQGTAIQDLLAKVGRGVIQGIAWKDTLTNARKSHKNGKKSLTFGNIIRYSTEFLLLCHACNKAIADTDNIGAPSGSAPRCPFWATARSHKRIKSWGAAIRPTAPTACMTPVASQPGGYVVKKFLKGALKKQNQRLLFIIKTDNYNFYTYI